MGAIRSILLVGVCILLFFSVLAGGLLWTVSSSLQYENVQSGLSSLVDKFIDEQLGSVGDELNIEDEISELMPEIEAYCQDNSEYTFDYEGETIVIPCNVLAEGPEAVINEGVDSLIEQYYYQEYNCDFWNCFSEGEIPLFLISQKSQEYWQGKLRLAFLASIALAVLVFLLAEKKTNFFILVGGLSIVAALPLIRIERLTSRLSGLMGDLGDYASEIILVFFNQADKVFIRIIIFGATLIAIGIVLKVFHLGVGIAKFMSKFGGKRHKKIRVKKEKKKDKKEDKEEKAPKGIPSKEGKEKKEEEKKDEKK